LESRLYGTENFILLKTHLVEAVYIWIENSLNFFKINLDPVNFEKINEILTTAKSALATEDNDNISIVAGCAVAGFVLLLIIVVGVVCGIRRKRQDVESKEWV